MGLFLKALVLSALLLHAVSGFQLTSITTRTRPSVGSTVSHGALKPLTMSLSIASAAPAVKWVLAAPSMYALMSWNEYVTHRYFQHAGFNKSGWMQKLASLFYGKGRVPRVRGGGHVEHHAETLDDMSLRNDARWAKSTASKMLSQDKYRGTAFTWQVTLLMTIQMLVTTVPLFHLLGFSLTSTVAMLMPGMLLHGLVWNALHPAMHGLPFVPITEGAPSSWLASFTESAYFKWLYTNHAGHHVLGGQVNYNVCCPLVDHLLGTYVPEEAWRPKVRTAAAVIQEIDCVVGGFGVDVNDGCDVDVTIAAASAGGVGAPAVNLIGA